MVNHGDHQMQMLPLADNPPCFFMVITHLTAGVCKYFFNSMQPSYIAQNAPKDWKQCEEKNMLHGEAYYPRKHLAILTAYLRLKHISINDDSLAARRIVSDDDDDAQKGHQSNLFSYIQVLKKKIIILALHVCMYLQFECNMFSYATPVK